MYVAIVRATVRSEWVYVCLVDLAGGASSALTGPDKLDGGALCRLSSLGCVFFFSFTQAIWLKAGRYRIQTNFASMLSLY